MRSQMTRLTVPAVLICFALVSSSGAWARPVHEPAPVLQGEISLAESLVAWTLSLLFETLGVPHTIDLTTRAGGHSWDYFSRMADAAVRFLVAGLEEESRRLL